MSGAAIDLAIGMARWPTALHADGSKLDDFVSRAHEAGHGSEGSPSEILIKAGTDHFNPFISKIHAELDNPLVKELNFLNADNFSIFGDGCRKFINSGYGDSFVPDPHVGHNHAFVIAAVDFGLKDADSPLGIKGSSSSSDEFF